MAVDNMLRHVDRNFLSSLKEEQSIEEQLGKHSLTVLSSYFMIYVLSRSHSGTH